MPDAIKKTWPATSRLKNSTLVFSGTFDSARIQAERRQDALRLAGKVLLVVIIIIGGTGFALSAASGILAKNPAFLIERNIYNLAFWVGLFMACYFWAQTRQNGIDSRALNLLRWENPNDAMTLPEEIDVYDYFSEQARQVWRKAFAFGNRLPDGTMAISAINLLQALMLDRGVCNIFYRLSVNPEDIKTFLRNYERLADSGVVKELKDIPFFAFNEALKLHDKKIDPLMLLCALKLALPEKHIVQAIFFNLDVEMEDLETVCSWQFNLELMRDEVRIFSELAGFKPSRETNRGLTAVPTPYLNRFSTDLTLLAKYGQLPLTLGRDRDLQAVFQLLANERKSICIKSGVGTGRTTLIDELAYKMVTEQVPASLADMRLVKLETSSILGAIGSRAEQALMHCLQEAELSENIALVVADIHELAHGVTDSGMSLLEILTGFLSDHNLTVFATTTPEEFTDYLSNSANFEHIFTPYELRTFTNSEILLACCIKASILEHKNRCFFRYPAIKQAVQLTDAYIKNMNQPQKTVAVLVEAASRAKGATQRIIDTQLIQSIISEKTHIPSRSLSEDESSKLLGLEDSIGKYIIGQRPAVIAVSEGLRRARSGLASENRPLASFLFLGPTGVGKTEVAKTLARVYFGEEKYLLRLDMSEYQGEDGLIKLIGTETSKADTALIKHLKNYPFCLLLLDEFEKASPQVLNLFLQILEDGRLTSGKGELVDLTHCLIIATSNAASADIQTGLAQGLNIDQIKARLLDQLLLKYYPPELLNRFDGVIIFSPLSQEEITAIVHLQLQILQQQLLAKGIKMTFTNAVASDIATKAFEPTLGARPIRRYIQDHVETFIAKLILQKSLDRGSEVIVDLKDGQMVIV